MYKRLTMEEPHALPLVSLTTSNKLACLLCDHDISDNEKQQVVQENGWNSIKIFAEKWSLTKPTSSYAQNFNLVWYKICHLHPSCTNERIHVHTQCRQNFTSENKLKTNATNGASFQHCPEQSIQDSSIKKSSSTRESVFPGRCKRKANKNAISDVCFVCEKKRKKRGKREEILQKVERDDGREKLKKAILRYESSNDMSLACAAERLKIATATVDIFAAGVKYHKSCYNRFVYVDERQKQEFGIVITNQQEAEKEFLRMIRKKVIEQKFCYFLSDLIEDLSNIYSSKGCEDDIGINHTNQLKNLIDKEFGGEVGFSVGQGIHGNPFILHSTTVNPLDYSLATIRGAGLRDDDITKAFAKMINKKLKSRERNNCPSFPMSHEDLMYQLENYDPLPEIFNAIALSINPSHKMNTLGYVMIPTEIQASKVWSIAGDWQRLITGEHSPKSTILSLVIHRLTGSKEAINLLHKSAAGISYSDVIKQNKKLAEDTKSQTRRAPLTITCKRPTHVTIDNSDGKQQTLTGSATTHHTNSTIYVPRLPNDVLIHDSAELNMNSSFSSQIAHPSITSENTNYVNYKIGKRMPPTIFEVFDDNLGRSELDKRLHIDCALALASCIESSDVEEPLPVLGSWTAFNKQTTATTTVKSDIDFLPVIPQEPNYAVCKYYLDMLVDLTNNLHIQHIFSHSDHAVFCKLAQIIWKEGKYEKIINLMGGLHVLMVRQKILYKRYGAMGLREWWVQACVIADGSVDQAVEGRHYSRSMRLHKQSLESLLRFQATKLLETIPESLCQKLIELRRSPSPETLHSLITDECFKDIQIKMLEESGTMGRWVKCYIYDTSSLLSQVAAYRDKNLNLHLQAQRDILPLLFAFNHPNYARYLTWHHLDLVNLKFTNENAYKELEEYGLGGSLSGERFSTIPGDHITEVTINREVKVRGGPMQGGYSTSTETTGDFVINSHKLAKLRIMLKEKMMLKTSMSHKEITQGAMKKHDCQVKELMKKLHTYADPFSGVARHIASGIEISPSIADGLLNAKDTGEDMLNLFIKDRLLSEKTSFFAPIKRSGIVTGLNPKKEKPKIESVLKEDRQALGIIVAKCLDKKDALSYPLTTYPLAIAMPNGKLYKPNTKHIFRNYLIDESAACSSLPPPLHSVYIYDAMAMIWAIPAQATWEDLWKSFIIAFTPPANLSPAEVILVFDNYENDEEFSVKQVERLE